MKRIARLLPIGCLALLSALPALAKDKVQTVKFDFNGKQRTYSLLIPSKASPTEPLPAVMLLHYQGGWASNVMMYWHDFAALQGFIAIAPESNSNTLWDSKVDGPDFLHAVMVDAAKKHPIDPTKVFMFGDDSGGNYGIELALFDSQDWGAVCAEHAIIATNNYSLFKDAQRKIPFQVWVGDSDDDHPLRNMTAEHDAFTGAGFPFDLKIIQNSVGDYGNQYDRINEGCYNFFMKNPLPAPGAAYLAAAEAAAPAAAPAAPPTK
jgi:poly(3-hydroxybutyrate) depolymerase